MAKHQSDGMMNYRRFGSVIGKPTVNRPTVFRRPLVNCVKIMRRKPVHQTSSFLGTMIPEGGDTLYSLPGTLARQCQYLFMVALCNRETIYIFILFLSSSFFFFLFFSSPNLSGRRLDVYHTLAHGVASVRIQNAGLKCAARGSLQIQDAKKSPKIAISTPSHNFVWLYLRN